MHENSRHLIEKNLRLVEVVVRKLAGGFPRHVDRAELMSAGMLGLVEAAVRYDPDRGVPFAPYAHRRISGAVLDSCRSSDWAPRSVRAAARSVEWSEQELVNRTGRTPTTQELSRAVGMTTDDYHHLRAQIHRGIVETIDLTEVDPHDQATATVDPYADPALTVEVAEQISYLRDAVSVLPERHREVIAGSFFEGRSDRDIAATLGVTTSRVSQLRADALEMLKDGIDAQFTPVDHGPRVGRVAQRKARYAAAVASSSTYRARLTPAFST